MSAMLLILNIIITILVILFLIIIMLLFIPFEYRLRGNFDEDFCGEASINWFFGLVKFLAHKGKSKCEIGFILCGKKISARRRAKNKNSKKERSKEKKKPSKKIDFTRKLISIFYNYCMDVLNIVKPKYFKAVGVYGCEDPSITGFICAFISIINEVIPNRNINLQPVFEEEILDIESEVYGAVVPMTIVYKTLRLIMKKEVRKIIFTKNNKKVKHLKG